MISVVKVMLHVAIDEQSFVQIQQYAREHTRYTDLMNYQVYGLLMNVFTLRCLAADMSKDNNLACVNAGEVLKEVNEGHAAPFMSLYKIKHEGFCTVLINSGEQ